MEERTLTGAVVFDQAIAAGDGSVRVTVEDVGRADVAAIPIATTVLAIDRAIAAGGALPFSLAVPAADLGRTLAVRVHVDRSGDGVIAEGDRISTASHPIPEDAAADLQVPVTTI